MYPVGHRQYTNVRPRLDKNLHVPPFKQGQLESSGCKAFIISMHIRTYVHMAIYWRYNARPLKFKIMAFIYLTKLPKKLT